MRYNTRVIQPISCQWNRWPLRCAVCLIVCVTAGRQNATGAQTRTPLLFTQRDINALAAPLERTRHLLLFGPPMRLAKESVNLYLRRLAQQQAGETPAAYQGRIAGYLQAFQQSVVETAPARAMPAHLRDDSPANCQRWQAIVHALSLLPRRVEKTRRVWQQARSDASFQTLPASLSETSWRKPWV